MRKQKQIIVYNSEWNDLYRALVVDENGDPFSYFRSFFCDRAATLLSVSAEEALDMMEKEEDEASPVSVLMIGDGKEDYDLLGEIRYGTYREVIRLCAA